MEYIYKVYDSAGSYLKTWTDVATKPEFVEEINTVGYELSLVLKRNPLNLSSDVAENNLVKIYTNETTPVLKYTGRIMGWSPSFNHSEITVNLESHGLDFSYKKLDLGDVIDKSDSYSTLSFYKNNLAMSGTGNPYLFYEATIDHNMYLSYLDVWAKVPAGYEGRQLYSAVIVDNVTLFANYLPITNSDGWAKYTQDISPTLVQSGSTVKVYFEVDASDLSVGVTCLQMMTSSASGKYGWYSHIEDNQWPGNSPRFVLGGGTTLSQLSQDPADMLRLGLFIYQDISGGSVTFTEASIDTCGFLTSYDFRGMTMLEFVKKIIELAPADWYFYVDTSGVMQLHQRTGNPDSLLTLGKDVLSFEPSISFKDQINTVYFQGKDLYRKYVDGSPTNIKAYTYTDERVSRGDTADTIAQTLLAYQNTPAVSFDAPVTKTLTLGQNVSFRGLKESETSLWGVAHWNVAYWGFNIYDPETWVLQITKLSTQGQVTTASFSLRSPDVTKRIEDINRRLNQLQASTVAEAPEVI